ncbi:MAG: DUF4303 domain-containing protein [Clostridium sp.]
MFDYKEFESDILTSMEIEFKKYVKINEDIYAFGLDCTRDMTSIGIVANTKSNLAENAEYDSEDYGYYKYCEEEWEIFNHFEKISKYMNNYMEDNLNKFTNPNTCKFTSEFHIHFNKIIDICIKALVSLKEECIDKYRKDIILTFNIREHLTEVERCGYFERINGKESSKEYSKHIKEFV